MYNPYKEIDNISSFTHPLFNEKFRYMNDIESVDLSIKILNKFINSNYDNIVIIESGTSPLLNIIKKLEKYKNSDIKFHQIKIPRDLDFDLFNWFKTYLDEDELQETLDINNMCLTRQKWLEDECRTFKFSEFIEQKQFTIYDSIIDNYIYNISKVYLFQRILDGTNLGNVFNSPFLLFDEYINAGTIIRNFNCIVRLFTNNPVFKLSAFCMFLDNPEKYEKIAFTIYDNSNELECYRKGAYPFENRIDLIGYYYFVDKNNFEKIYLDKLLEKQNSNLNCEEFYELLEKLINNNDILRKLKNTFNEEQVRNYITNDDIKRYMIKYIEKQINGNTLYYDLLDQVFEIYAPAWSPMPVKFHLDYWNGFVMIEEEIKKNMDNIKEEYLKYRNSILHDIIVMLIENRNSWLKSIDNILEVKNENN